MANFEWDPNKEQQNIKKYGISFLLAQQAFLDEFRINAEDLNHSQDEKRYYCFGMVNHNILTVRFTYRRHIIRIIGAGYWRKGKQIYEEENQIHE